MRLMLEIAITPVALCCAIGAIAQTPQWEIVTPTQSDQKAYLDSLITDKTDKAHPHNLIRPLLVKSETSETNLREVCSGSTSGSATTANENAPTNIELSSTSVCLQLADVHNETVMGLPDPANHQVWLIFTACTEGFSRAQKSTALATMGYGALFMHKHPCLMQEGPNLSVVLAQEKSGYYIYVGTTSQLGGKAKVSQYSVVEVKLFKLKSAN